ncbi:MAG: YggT family protein [Chloroflexota bacterium]|nr:YggT family protein [Chloroflexota bacterium]
MTDYDRTTVRETTTAVDEPVVARPGTSDRVVTREATHRSGPSAGEVVRRFVMLLFGILQALLIIRIVLLLLVANHSNDVVALILGVTDPFVEPFRGMFQLDKVTAGRSMLDLAAVVALIAWTLVEGLIVAVLGLGARRGGDATV